MYMICQFVFYMLYSISIFSRPEKGRTKARNLFLRDLHRPLSINFCLYSSIPATSVFFYGHHCAKSFEADFRKLCWRPTYLQFLEQYISISLAAGALLVLKKIYIYIIYVYQLVLRTPNTIRYPKCFLQWFPLRRATEFSPLCDRCSCRWRFWGSTGARWQVNTKKREEPDEGQQSRSMLKDNPITKTRNIAWGVCLKMVQCIPHTPQLLF